MRRGYNLYKVSRNCVGNLYCFHISQNVAEQLCFFAKWIIASSISCINCCIFVDSGGAIQKCCVFNRFCKNKLDLLQNQQVVRNCKTSWWNSIYIYIYIYIHFQNVITSSWYCHQRTGTGHVIFVFLGNRDWRSYWEHNNQIQSPSNSTYFQNATLSWYCQHTGHMLLKTHLLVF